MAEQDDIEDKLVAARTWLIIDKPFLGALVLRQPLVQADPKWCQTTATDARSFYYNRAYVDALSFEQTKFILAHEALHCALSHFARREHRDKRRWDVACDFAINSLLVADGLRPAPDALILDAYKDMTAEEIYPCIQENPEQKPMDQHLYDQEDSAQGSGQRGGGAGGQGESPDDGGGSEGELDAQAHGAPQPPPLSAPEREALHKLWQQRLASAAQQAIQSGKLGGSMARLVDHLLQPQLPWRMLLAHYLTRAARDDYSFAHPSKREGAAILPGLRSQHIDLIIALDTSGSISDEEMREFVSEVNAIKGQVGARITMHACDDSLARDGPWTFEPWEEIKLPKQWHGGGGTRFTPVFDWAGHQDRPPDLLLYFTDAKGEFPGHEPSFPVLWLVKGREKVPWGQRIQLN
ncbi:MAG: VWA-like domain-containing protein [Gammaproteobacteria bacterium]|nr:VWA-like domain-containing protein [Gammaproteobacteria bacterium]MDH3371020.1 VWA-like domain-containing protein [Gammaproteobacteria bacterium]